MTTVLTIDTASSTLLVGLVHRGVSFQKQEESHRHGDRLLQLIQELLFEHHLTLDKLDGIVVRQGIGSYTGLRIGVATATALAWAQAIPITGVFSRARRPLTPAELFARADFGTRITNNWPVITPRYQHWHPVSGFGRIGSKNG